ncbi:hypothetical protein MD484_g1465, partial [Candolleomyces efflorescens]
MPSWFSTIANFASSSQPRRTTRSTRTVRDAENAVVVRPTRATSLRAKATSGGAAAQAAPVTTRATAPTAASKAKAVAQLAEGNVGKRKREALAEVPTGANKSKPSASGAKGKEKEGTVSKPTATTAAAATTTTTRVLRRAGSAAPSGATRIAKATSAEPSTGVKKILVRKVDVKPPSAAAPKVFRDPPVAPPSIKEEEEVKEEDEDYAETRRANKRRHMDAIPNVVIPPKREEPNDSQIEADKIAKELVKAEPESSFEREPEPQELWDDLDADDWDDPLMVSEYVKDVVIYWKEIEQATLPDHNYMNHQNEINWEHRGILVDWILQVHNRFNLLSESLFLTVNLIDRFLSLRPISLNKLQLVGLACFFIATKFEETCAPSVSEIVFLSDNQYSVPEVLKAEMYILKIVEWDLRCPGPMNWLRRGSKADECDGNARTVAKYFTEIACLERRLVGVVPSLIAAAALWLGRLVVCKWDWTPNLEHYTTFSEEAIMPVAGIMMEYVCTTPIQHESVYTKYLSKRHLKCSHFVRDWGLDRWGENPEYINMAKDSIWVKGDIRHLQEQAQEMAGKEVEGRY